MTLITKPNQKDWQKSQWRSFSKNSFGALICAHSRIPHLIASVRKNFTARLTKNTYAINSSMVFLL